MEALMVFAAAVLPVYENCLRDYEYAGASWRCTPTWNLGALPIIIVFSVGVGIILFSYLHNVASVSFHHSIPVKRKTVYVTKLLSAVTLTFIPIILNAMAFAAMAVSAEFSEFFGLRQVSDWACAGFLYTFVLVALTMVVSMMTGSSVGVLVFTAGFALLPLAFVSFFQLFFDFELYGYTPPVTYAFIEHIYASEKNILSWSYLLTYVVMSILFCALGYLLYRRRKLENHGEVIAYLWLKPVFITIISIISSMLSYLYFTTVLEFNSVWLILPAGLFGTIVAWMISRKSLSLKGIIKPIGLYAAVALAFCLVIQLDLTGFEKRVPEIEDIESATIVRKPRYYSDDVEVYEEQNTDFTEERDIENVIALHEHLINTEETGYIRTNTLPVEYTLKNGKVIRREYTVNYEQDAKYLKPIYETYEMRAYRYPIIDESEKDYTYIHINDRRIGDWEIYPDNVYMQKIIEALRADVSQLEYDQMMINNGGSAVIDIRYTLESVKDGYTSDAYFINHNYTNTEKVLQEMGFYKNLPAKFDFQSASVSVWDSIDYEAEQKARENPTVITDINEIATLYSFYDTMIDDKKFTDEYCMNISVEYTLRSGHTFEVSCSYDRDRIPAEIKKYFY